MRALVDVTICKKLTVISRSESGDNSSQQPAIRCDTECELSSSRSKTLQLEKKRSSADSIASTFRRSSRIAVWVSKSCNLAYCIGRPRHFDEDECCPDFAYPIENIYCPEAFGRNSLTREKTRCGEDSITDQVSKSECTYLRMTNIFRASSSKTTGDKEIFGGSDSKLDENMITQEDSESSDEGGIEFVSSSRMSVERSIVFQKNTVTDDENQTTDITSQVTSTSIESLSKESGRQCLVKNHQSSSTIVLESKAN